MHQLPEQTSDSVTRSDQSLQLVYCLEIKQAA